MEELNIKRILVPLDFLDMTGAVVGHGGGLARRFGAAITLLHVVHVPSLAEAGTWLDPAMSPSFEQSLKKQMLDTAQKKLGEITNGLSADGIEADIIVSEGEPITEILRIAEEKKFDLIVMGSHGRTGLSHFLLGSVAERVVRRARCNVFCVKAHVHED